MTDKTYHEQLKERNYEVSPEDYAGHRNYLQRATPVLKDFERLVKDFRSKFTPQEERVLHEALRILDNAAVPLALLKKVEEEPPIILGYDYRRG